MTPTKPHDAPLNDQAQKLLHAIRDTTGDWVTRGQIADTLNKKRLNPYEVALLQILIERGLVEVRQEADSTPIGFKYTYRIVRE